VLPDTTFGLIHGKAGVIRYVNGSSIAFLGSVNESASAWMLNYGLLWERTSRPPLPGRRRSSTPLGTTAARI